MEVKTDKYKKLLQEFDTHIISTKSIQNGNHYTGHIKEFLSFLERFGIFSIRAVRQLVMQDYFEYLVTRPKHRGTGTLSISSINDHLSTLRMFSKRMQQSGDISKALVIPNNLKDDRDEEYAFLMTRQILSTDEVKEVFEACEQPLEKALIALCYGCGLRRNVLANLKDAQLNFSKGMVTALKAKGNKTREVPISDFFLGVLKEYSYWRLRVLSSVNSREQRFFMDWRGVPMTGDRLNRWLKKIIHRTGNQEIIDKDITLHCLRHSITAHLLDSGQTYDYVKNFLGHSFVDTSSIYAKRRNIKNMYTI